MTAKPKVFKHCKVSLDLSNAQPLLASPASVGVKPKFGDGNAYAACGSVEEAEKFAAAIDAKAESDEAFVEWLAQGDEQSSKKYLEECEAAVYEIGAELSKDQNAGVSLPITLKYKDMTMRFRDVRLALVQLEALDLQVESSPLNPSHTPTGRKIPRGA